MNKDLVSDVWNYCDKVQTKSEDLITLNELYKGLKSIGFNYSAPQQNQESKFLRFINRQELGSVLEELCNSSMPGFITKLTSNQEKTIGKNAYEALTAEDLIYDPYLISYLLSQDYFYDKYIEFTEDLIVVKQKNNKEGAERLLEELVTPIITQVQSVELRDDALYVNDKRLYQTGLLKSDDNTEYCPFFRIIKKKKRDFGEGVEQAILYNTF